MIHTVGLDPERAALLGMPWTPLALPLEDGKLPGGEEGWIVVAEDVPCDTLAILLRAVVRHPMRWALLMALEGRGDTLRLAPISVGNPVPSDFVAERLAEAPGVFSLRHATHAIARIRHDLNNPLTAALSEVQLMRMDSNEAGLEVIETQLRRLRDLTGELAKWRLPR
jgi:signal transduction histidine kinase